MTRSTRGRKRRQLSERWSSTKALAQGQGVDVATARALLFEMEAAGVIERQDVVDEESGRQLASLWRLRAAEAIA